MRTHHVMLALTFTMTMFLACGTGNPGTNGQTTGITITGATAITTITTGSDSGGSGGGMLSDAGSDSMPPSDAGFDAKTPDGGCVCPLPGCFFLTEGMRVCNPCEPNPQWSKHENDSCAERCCTFDDPAIILSQQVCTWMHNVSACNEPFPGAGDVTCKLFNGSTCGRCWTNGIQDNRCGIATAGCWMDGCSWVH